MGADDEVDPVADRGVPGPADAGDPAVLDADVGLDDADDRVDDERAGEDDVELRRSGRLVPLRDPAAEVLGVAPDRLVAPAVRSSATRIHRSVSPSRTRSPVVGP